MGSNRELDRIHQFRKLILHRGGRIHLRKLVLYRGGRIQQRQTTPSLLKQLEAQDPNGSRNPPSPNTKEGDDSDSDYTEFYHGRYKNQRIYINCLDPVDPYMVPLI